ncbi:MAG: hypothetical protein WC551_05960 [Patescibacteria group bacterium]
MDFSHLQTAELDERLFAQASLTREGSLKLLERLAATCQPYDGEEPILLFIARIAMRVWLRGCLHLEVQTTGHDSNILCLTVEDDNRSDVVFEASLRSSFSRLRLITEDPLTLQPFELYESLPGKLKLEALQIKRNSTIPPIPFLDANAELNRCRDLYFESERPAWTQNAEDDAITKVWNVAPRFQDVMGTKDKRGSVPEIDSSEIEELFDEQSGPKP